MVPLENGIFSEFLLVRIHLSETPLSQRPWSMFLPPCPGLWPGLNAPWFMDMDSLFLTVVYVPVMWKLVYSFIPGVILICYLLLILDT